MHDEVILAAEVIVNGGLRQSRALGDSLDCGALESVIDERIERSL
jgi:hypothetical protein